MSAQGKITAGSVVLGIISVIIAFIFLTPVIWSLAVSFKTEGTPIRTAFDWFRPPYTLDNYPRI